METMKNDEELNEREKSQALRAKRMNSIKEVLEKVEVLSDAYHFNEFSKTKSSMFLKRIITNQNTIEIRLFRKTWRTLNCSPKTRNVIWEIQENLVCVGKRRELNSKKPETQCRCSKTGLPLNAKHS